MHFLPGGKTAGQVPLRYVLEDLAENAKIAILDNEYELDELARDSKSSIFITPFKNNDITVEMSELQTEVCIYPSSRQTSTQSLLIEPIIL